LQLHFSADEWWTEITASESVKVRHKVWLAKEAKRGIKDPFTPSDWATQTRPPAPVVTLTTGLDEVAQTTAAYVKATWTRPDWRHIDRYAVRIRRVGSDTYQYQETKELSVTFHGLISGVEYGVQVAVIDGRGVMGEPSPEVTITTPKDQTIPATPTGLTVTSHIRGVEARIEPNTEPDLRHYIWEYRIGASGSWQVLARDLVTNRAIPAEAGQTVQVRVSAEDWSGNVSPPTTVVSAVAGKVGTSDILFDAIESYTIVSHIETDVITTTSTSYIDSDLVTPYLNLQAGDKVLIFAKASAWCTVGGSSTDARIRYETPSGNYFDGLETRHTSAEADATGQLVLFGVYVVPVTGQYRFAFQWRTTATPRPVGPAHSGMATRILEAFVLRGAATRSEEQRLNSSHVKTTYADFC